MTPRHHSLCHLEEFIESIDGIRRCAAPGEGRHGLGRRLRAVDIGARAKDGSGRQARPDARLRMIAKHRSEELHAAVAHSPRRPERDRTIGVLEIARDRAGAKVYPASEVRVADEAIVALVRVTDHDRVAHLAAHLAMIADGTGADAI